MTGASAIPRSRAIAACAPRSWSKAAARRSAGRLRSGPARSSCSTAEIGRIDARDRHARPCRPLPRHRRLAAAAPGARRRRCRSMRAPTTLERLRARFAYAFDASRLLSGRSSSRSRSTANDLRRLRLSASSTSRMAASRRSACASTRAARSLAYAIDFHDLTADMAELYDGVDVWIADCLTRTPHPTHAHLERCSAGRGNSVSGSSI